LQKGEGGLFGEAHPAPRQTRIRVPVVRCWRSGSPDRGPPKANGEGVATALKVLSSGADSLYVSIRGEVASFRLEELEVLKVRAQELGQPQPVALEVERRALVQPSGWGRYRYWLRCGDFDIFVARGTTPPAGLRTTCELFHSRGRAEQRPR
jgi:hypothetical protein